MDINHPLYITLKDYYTHSDEANKNILKLYIEDTCGLDKEDARMIDFSTRPYDKIYFSTINDTFSKNDDIIYRQFNCYFTNKFLCGGTYKDIHKEKKYYSKLGKYNYILVHEAYNVSISIIIVFENNDIILI